MLYPATVLRTATHLRLEISGCINPELWPKSSGRIMSLEAVWRALDRGRVLGDLGVTCVGGEPFDQPQALAQLCTYVRNTWPEAKTAPRLIIYTGYTLEALLARSEEAVFRALEAANVLVDGRFIRALFDAGLSYRGSRNQRVIDLPHSLNTGRVITLDWDRPRITIYPDGVIVTSPMVARRLAFDMPTGRHCGQFRVEE